MLSGALTAVRCAGTSYWSRFNFVPLLVYSFSDSVHGTDYNPVQKTPPNDVASVIIRATFALMPACQDLRRPVNAGANMPKHCSHTSARHIHRSTLPCLVQPQLTHTPPRLLAVHKFFAADLSMDHTKAQADASRQFDLDFALLFRHLCG
jgi:hypothetical protein